MALQTVTLGDAITLSVPMRTGGAAFTPAAGYQLIFTAKLATSDADVAALIQKKSGGFGITESGSSALIELLPIDTSALSGDITLYCDIQAQSLTDASVIKTVALFQLLTVRDVTRDTDTSIPVYTSEPPGIAYIKAEAQSGSFTAVANFQYTLLATGTVTDPATAEEGDAFTVFVSAGTGTIGGTAYPAEAIIIRSYESAAWKNTAVGNGDALVADPLSQFAATTSAQLAGVLTDETGTGSAVFATSPTLTSPVLNTGVSGSAILDEDDLASDSDKLATQRSIKAYVDDAIKAVTITAKVNEAGGITKGQVVFISGATGGFPQVSLADNTDFSKADVLAVSTETKTDGQNVAITIAGLVENIDTSAYTEGAVLYLGTSGNITEIHPTGIHAVERIGHAVKINASTGSILVELDGLTVINDHDGIMRHQIVNQNAGTSASAAYTIVNDALRRSSISMVGSNYNVVAGISNSLIIYNEGYNKTVNAVDGNYGFEWWTDETDSHNLTSTSKMSLTADGELNTLVQTIDHTATEADDHALEIDCDAAGFGDVKAIDVAYHTGAITPWQDEAVMLVNINQSAAIGGDVTALEVLATEGSANIHGMLAGAGVNPIEQLSGVFYDMDSALVNATDRLTEFTTAGNDVQMFVADNDTVTIGSAAKFEELEFLLAITASLSIRPSFEFSTGPATWQTFTPVDGTNGMRNTGVIAWLRGDIPTWAVGTGGEYLIRITRRRNSLATPPTESKVQIAATTAYKWDKDGDLIINTVTATGNVDSANTGANAPVSTAQQAALDLKASSAIQSPIESLPSVVINRDECYGDAQTMGNGDTRDVEPGPGTLTASVSSTGSVRYENGEALLSGPGNAILHSGPRTVAAGLTMIARIVPAFEVGGSARNSYVGFSHSGTSGTPRRGLIVISNSSGDLAPTIHISKLSSNASDAKFYAGIGLFKEGEEIGLRVQYVTDAHQTYSMQGGVFATIAPLGSDDWVLLGETFTDLSGLTCYPTTGQQFDGTLRIRSRQLLSSHTASPRHTTLDYNRDDLGTHIPSSAIDPVSGLVVHAWNRGFAHIGEGIASIRYSTELADGTFSAVSDLIAAPSSPAGQSINSLSIVNGILRLVYWKATDGADGGTLYWRTVAINSTTGAATLGTETLMGVTGTTNLSFSHIITETSGRIWIPYHHTGDDGCYASYSDNNGTSWTEVTITGTSARYEPTLEIESDGAIGCVARSSGNTARYFRCADPTGSPGTWSSEVELSSIPQPGGNGARMQLAKNADGRIYLVGNDHKTDRRNITIWEMGDSGAVIGKFPIYDWNAVTTTDNTTAILQYPRIIFDGEDIILSASRQPNGGGSLSAAIQVDRIRWVNPVAVDAGGTGERGKPREFTRRDTTKASILTYGTDPVPNLSVSSLQYITLTASTATIGVPLNPLPWDELEIVFIQGGAGSFTAAFNAIFEFGGITPAWQTAVDSANTLKARFNPITTKWNVISFEQAELSAFTSTTRPTSAGTGIPAATSLVTLDDVRKDMVTEYTVFPQISGAYGVSQALTSSGLNQANTQNVLSQQSGGTLGGKAVVRIGQYLNMSPGDGRGTVNFDRKFSMQWMAISVFTGTLNEGILMYPQAIGYTSGGLTNKGFGWKQIGGEMYGQTHDGTTLRTTSASFSLTYIEVNLFEIRSDGAGNYSFYYDGTLLETLVGATGTRNVGSPCIVADVENKAAGENIYIIAQSLKLKSWT